MYDLTMTPRQEEILSVLAQGYSIADAACVLGIRGDSISKMRWNEEFWARWKVLKASAEYKSAFSARYDFHGPPVPEALPRKKPYKCRLDEKLYRDVARLLADGKTRAEVCQVLHLRPDQLRRMIPKYESGALPWADVNELWSRVKTNGGYAPEKNGWIYFIQASSDKSIKIGYESLKFTRVQSGTTWRTDDLKIIGHMRGTQADERRIHSRFAAFRIREDREWFWPHVSILEFIRNFEQLPLLDDAQPERPRGAVYFSRQHNSYRAIGYDARGRFSLGIHMTEDAAWAAVKTWHATGEMPQRQRASKPDCALGPNEVKQHQICGVWKQLKLRIWQGEEIRVLRHGEHVFTLKKPTENSSHIPEIRSQLFFQGRAIERQTHITAHGRPVALVVPA